MEQALNAWLAAHPEIEAIPGRDLFIVARYLVPMEATLMQGCLEASGIPAVLADAHLMQTDLLLAPALGGVRILVPSTYLQQAQAVIEAFGRGEFELDDNTAYE
ncbi:putative signal transducing protein [Massilia sp. GCM10023247]|uniref:putative signal transducing protein n=1 Tax=Massilia sp. GCM10023247 TaxID=3252643 RepID=UPI0036181041